MKQNELMQFLDEHVAIYNRPNFILDDPVGIIHRFSKLQDIEIIGLWTAVLAWGQRKTIINKAEQLIALMDGRPHEFVLGHSERELKNLLDFKHRTFNATDTLYFVAFFKWFYEKYDSLEEGFVLSMNEGDENVENALLGFKKLFFSLDDFPPRTKKHIASPITKSTCKRLNMFLRWMVRRDDKGVDLGLWRNISPSQLLCPLDVHVERVGRRLGLITRKQRDWLTVLELTENLKKFDPEDPVKYDFALFGIGVMEKQKLIQGS